MSALAYAAARACPAAVLALPAWLAVAVAPALGLATLASPVVSGATITFARAGSSLPLEDPYVLAGIPLYLGLWALAERPLSRVPWARLALGLAGLEVVAGITLAFVALCVARGWTTSPSREPLELVALVLVAVCRVMPLPAWLALDPTRGGIPLLREGALPGSSRPRSSK